ncbi:MAG: IS256 family transposase [Bacteroidales bacterium]|nr:IS256 family transposase [Bacteroidales bacterium]
MTSKNSITVIEELGKLLREESGDLLRASVEKLYNVLMELEAETIVGASKNQHSTDRSTYFNGKRNIKTPLKTAVGNINLSVPKLRNGSYYPSFVEPRRLTDKALVSVIQQAYVNGVSTRKVDNLVESMGLNIDKSKVSRVCKELDEIVFKFKNRPITNECPYIYLDATFPKVRESGTVCSAALLIAVAVNKNGEREILGFDIYPSESEEAWTCFLESLISRGLCGVKLVISDAHTGLKSAITKKLTGVAWQRCRVHFMRNVLAQVPQKQKGLVSAIVRTIFTAENKQEAKKQLSEVVNQLQSRFAKATDIIVNAEDEILTYMDFPQKHWQSIFSTNLIERLNKELRRRFNVVSVFPNDDAVIRLGGSILMEQHDEWAAAERRYMSAESMNELYIKAITGNNSEAMSLPA